MGVILNPVCENSHFSLCPLGLTLQILSHGYGHERSHAGAAGGCADGKRSLPRWHQTPSGVTLPLQVSVSLSRKTRETDSLQVIHGSVSIANRLRRQSPAGAPLSGVPCSQVPCDVVCHCAHAESRPLPSSLLGCVCCGVSATFPTGSALPRASSARVEVRMTRLCVSLPSSSINKR